MDKFEKALGIIIAESKPFEEGTEEPLFFLGLLRKKGFSEDEVNGILEKFKKEGIVAKDSVVGDGEFDRVLELDRSALLRLVSKKRSA